MDFGFKTNPAVLNNERIWLKLLGWPFLFTCIYIFLGTSPATGATSDHPIHWSIFETGGAGYTTPYTYLGQPLADHETGPPQDPTNGGTTPTGSVDLASASPLSNPGPADTPTFGYYDGGTEYDPADPSTMEDDYIFFRIRIAADPTHSVAFASEHWNILLDVDDDGYKEYWVDLQGSYKSNSYPDRVRILYNNNNTQLIDSKDTAALVDEFEARYDNEVLTAPVTSWTYPENHTRAVSVASVDPTDLSGDWWIDVQVPMTAFKDRNGNQVLFPDSPVGFVYSTSNSNTDPLQKDFMMDLNYLTSADPITFGDIVTLNGEPILKFVDSSLEGVSFYTIGDNIYTYVKYPPGNTGTTTNEYITVTVTDPSTGDDEQLTLRETSPNSGVFTNKGGASKPQTTEAVYGNSWIPSVTTSTTTVNETWTVTYLGADTWSVAGSVSGAQTSITTVGNSTPYTSDNGAVSFTLNTLTPNVNDFIQFSTYPADPLSSTDSITVDEDGSLTVASGDTIQFSFTTPGADTYTSQTNIVGSGDPFIEFTRATGLPADEFELTNNSATSDKLYVTVTYAAADTTGNPDTIWVQLIGTDSEYIQLTETGNNTGIFRNAGLLTQVSDGIETTDDGLWEDIDGELVTASYLTASTSAYLFYIDGAGRVSFTNASGTQDVNLYTSGQTVYIKVNDENEAGSGTLSVTVTNSGNADSESVILYETATDSGVFMNRPNDLVTTDGSAIISSASSTFDTDGLAEDDIFTILTGPDAGSYLINTVDSPTQITLKSTLNNTRSGIPFITPIHTLLTTETCDTISCIDEADVLEVSHDDIITVSYTDADDGDVDYSNDVKTDTATYKAPPVVINEVFFYPSTVPTDNQTEYFQVYNASGQNENIYGYTITDGDTFSYTFQTGPGETGNNFTLEPGERAYVFLYANDLSNNNYFDSSDTFYLFGLSGDADAEQPSNQFNDPTTADKTDQLLLYDGDPATAQLIDYVGWSDVTEPTVDFLGDDSPAVSGSIWQDDAYKAVYDDPLTLGINESIDTGEAITRISDGYDTDVPSDWTYPVDVSFLFGAGGPVVTRVSISSFEALNENGRVMLQWETAYENGTVGFYLFRREEGQFWYKLVNEDLVPGLINTPQGGTYRFNDDDAVIGKTYSYLLEEVVETGERIEYGPYTVKAPRMAHAKQFNGTFDRKEHKPAGASLKRQQRIHTSSAPNESRRSSRKSNKRNRRFATPSRPDALKIPITENGLYSINAEQIAEQFGLRQRDVTRFIRRNQLELSSQGQSIPYFKGNNDKSIYFYGFKYNDVFTATNIFWLSLNSGDNMETEELAGLGRVSTDQFFIDTIHVEKDLKPALSQPWDSTEDYWIWNYVFAGRKGLDFLKLSFQAENVFDTSDNALITLYLIGGSADSNSIDHLAEVSLNGSWIGDCAWRGIDLLDCELEFPQDLLNEGDNFLEVQGRLVGGAGFSLFFVDSFDVHYARHYQAVNNSLQLRGDEYETIRIAGFEDKKIHLLDISNPYAPIRVSNSRVQRNRGGYFQLSFSPAAPDADYLAAAEPSVETVREIIPFTDSGLKSIRNQADYLIITAEELYDAAQELADYRSAQGYTVKTVTFNQVIDEFYDGIYSPLAIKKFLAYASAQWRSAPEFVVLIGETNYDYKDVNGLGGNLLPTIFVSTPHGMFASDNYLADINDDTIPDMAIGRLPVLVPEELHTIVEKIKDYESLAGDWKNKVLLLAGIPDDGADFASASNRISTFIPGTYSLEKIYLSDYKLDVARQILLTGLNEGAALVNYFGHGAVDRLSQYGLLTSTDVETMSSAGGAPIVTAMTCVVGEFIFPGYDTLAELLVLQPGGGATAVWSATGLSENDEAKKLDTAFYTAVYRDGESLLGKAINKAFYKYSLNSDKLYHISIYNLLGDPALRIY